MFTGVVAAVCSHIPGFGIVVDVRQAGADAREDQELEDWIHDFYKRFVILSSDVKDLRERAERPGFRAAVREADRIAGSDRRVVKLEMLRSVLFNAVMTPVDRPEEPLVRRYLRWIDELEPEHILVLRRSMFRPTPKLLTEQPDLADLVAAVKALSREFVAIAAAELEGRHLIEGHGIRLQETPIVPKYPRTALDPVGGGVKVRGFPTIEPVKPDLSNAWATASGRRFLDWLTTA